MFNVKNEYRDFSESIWGKILLNNLKDEITDSINSFKTVKLALDKFEELSKYSIVISDDINILQGLYNSLSYMYSLIEIMTWTESTRLHIHQLFQASVRFVFREVRFHPNTQQTEHRPF